MKEIDSIRRKIDNIDKGILLLVKKRNECSERIAVFKKKEGLKIDDISREKEINKIWLKNAEKIGIDNKDVLMILKDLIKISKRKQRNKIR